MTSICPTRLRVTATRNILLENKPTWKTDLVCERHDRALNMSKRTKQVNVIVVSRGVILLSDICGVEGTCFYLFYTWIAYKKLHS